MMESAALTAQTTPVIVPFLSHFIDISGLPLYLLLLHTNMVQVYGDQSFYGLYRAAKIAATF